MGAEGVGIRQDDVVLDVRDQVIGLLKRGVPLSDACLQVEADCKAQLDDPDEGPLFWIAIADVQWQFGEVEPRVLQQVRADLNSGRGLVVWAETGDNAVKQRKSVLETFVEKVSRPNPRPQKPPKLVVRKPLFRAGDCLSYEVLEGAHGAAYVLATDERDIEYGSCLIGNLDHLGDSHADLEVFKDRKWLRVQPTNEPAYLDIRWIESYGHREVVRRFKVVGNLPRQPSDPTTSHSRGLLPDLIRSHLMGKRWFEV